MTRAVARDALRDQLAGLGHEVAQRLRVAVLDLRVLVRAEAADLLAAEGAAALLGGLARLLARLGAQPPFGGHGRPLAVAVPAEAALAPLASLARRPPEA